jgi:hypothetical protein
VPQEVAQGGSPRHALFPFKPASLLKGAILIESGHHKSPVLRPLNTLSPGTCHPEGRALTPWPKAATQLAREAEGSAPLLLRGLPSLNVVAQARGSQCVVFARWGGGSSACAKSRKIVCIALGCAPN